jgi:hypothetical protein
VLLANKLPEGGHDIVIHGTAPSPVLLPVGTEVLQQDTNDENVVKLFDMFYLAFAKIVELDDLGNCPFPAQATEDGGSDHLLRIHLE